ncbi:sigma 54-interacting transcriptional regulator [Myxococcota bacterium]
MTKTDPSSVSSPTEAIDRAQSPLGGCRLDVIEGDDRGATFDLPAGSAIIGTDSTCELTLTDAAVSRRHVRIDVVETGLRVVDLGSTNGTLHLGTRLEQAVLPHGATLTVGRTRIALVSREPPEGGQYSDRASYGKLVGASPAMRRLYAMLERLEKTDYTLLIQGETGVGKEVVANQIHQHSKRADKPYEVFDCGAVPVNLAESELFGHVRGAFTGAESAREGVFIRANTGTVFLDEIGEMRLDLQPKLLRVLESRQVRAVGANNLRDIDVRVIAATNRNLADEVSAARFREDLFFRLNVVTVEIPPLRSRREDIPALVRHFLAMEQCSDIELSNDTWELLTCGYDWPGNVRELYNAVAHVVSLGTVPQSLSSASSGSPSDGDSKVDANEPYLEAKRKALDSFERDYLAGQLERSGNNLAKAARQSKIDRSYFKRLLRRHGLLPDRSS